MASQAEMEQLLGKAVFDEAFRTYILKAPEEAAKSVGIALNADQAYAIGHLDAETMEALAMLMSKEAIRLPSLTADGFWLARSGTDSSAS